MSVSFDAFRQEYTLLLKGQMTHRATLGTDPRGNLTRIDNALAQMPQRLEAVKAQLDNLYQQQAAAKEEVGKPFPYEEELRDKSARLAELDTLLNIDGKGPARTGDRVAKSTRPSVLEGLKRPVPPRGTDKKPKHHERRCDNMNTDEIHALYEKMAAEQDKFRDWLKSQPPEEVLNHAYEYTVREDIVMAMEELELPETRATALLASSTPLADVYKEFSKRETTYMDVVRDTIEPAGRCGAGRPAGTAALPPRRRLCPRTGRPEICTGRPAAPTSPARRPSRRPFRNITGTTGWTRTRYPR